MEISQWKLPWMISLRTARITFFVGHGKQHRCHKKACGKCEPRIFLEYFILKVGTWIMSMADSSQPSRWSKEGVFIDCYHK